MVMGNRQRSSAVWSILAAGAFSLASSPATATLEVTTAPTITGGSTRAVLDTATGLQWLTPQVTMGMSFAGVMAAGFASLNYRYATANELVALVGGAGFNTSPLIEALGTRYTSTDNADLNSLRALIGMLGNTTGDPFPITSNSYSNLLIYGILADTSPINGQLGGGSHYMATLDASGAATSIFIPGASFPTSDGNVGSFLVRDAAAVPEMGTYWLFSAGLLLLGLRRNIWRKSV